MDLKNKTVQSRRRSPDQKFHESGRTEEERGKIPIQLPIPRSIGRIHLPISIESNSSSTRDGGSRGVTGQSRRSARRATGAGQEGEEGTVARNDRPKGTRVTCTTQYRSRSALLLRDRVPYLKPLPSPPASLTATSLNSSPRDKQTLPPRD